MTHTPTHVSRWFLLLTALVTGAVVMALEILGSRLLAPVFGNSLFVWGALIGVFATPLVLLGFWHLFQGLSGANAWAVLATVGLFGTASVIGGYRGTGK